MADETGNGCELNNLNVSGIFIGRFVNTVQHKVEANCIGLNKFDGNLKEKQRMEETNIAVL